MAKFDLSTEIISMTGKPIQVPEPMTVEEFIDSLPNDLKVKIIPHYVNKPTKPMTAKYAIEVAVCTPLQEDDEKKKREKWDLYKQLRDGNIKECELTIQELAEIMKCVGKLQPQLIMGQVFDIIDPKPVKN